MHIAILGTGGVGRTLHSALVAGGHTVLLGSRSGKDDTTTFSEAAAASEVILLAVGGGNALAALDAAGSANLAGKVLIDICNPLDFSQGFPPSLSVSNTDSLAEQIQRAHPEAKVVKTLNTVANHLMVAPGTLAGGDHTLFVNGDDAEAKAAVIGWLGEWFGWSDVIDMGPLSTARGTEAWLLMWTRLYGALGHANFNLKIVR